MGIVERSQRNLHWASPAADKEKQTNIMVLRLTTRNYLSVAKCACIALWSHMSVAETALNVCAEKTHGVNHEVISSKQQIQTSQSRQSNKAVSYTVFVESILASMIDSHPNLRSDRIHISVEDHGLVVLSGKVENEAARGLAEQLVLSRREVQQVRNQIQVQKPQTASGETSAHFVDQKLSNVTITNKVKSQLLANRSTSGINIQISTSNRVVTITGQVGSPLEKELAYWVVRNTQGVKQVIDQIDIYDTEVRHASVGLSEPSSQ